MERVSDVRQYAPAEFQTNSKTHHEQTSQKPIPKFTSFRPKEQSPLGDKPKDLVENSATHREPHEKTHIRVRHRQSRFSKDEERKRREPQHNVERRRSTLVDPVILSYGEAESCDAIFISDKIGDPENPNFGTLSRYAIPGYSRIGFGNVIGSNSILQIDRAVSNEKGLVLLTQGAPKSYEKRLLRSVDRGHLRERRLTKQDESDDVLVRAADYIPLRSVTATTRRRDEDGRSISPTSTEDECVYSRSTSWNLEPSNQWHDPDLEYLSEGGSNVGSRPVMLDKALLQKRIELTHALDSRPHDTEAWLQLVRHQDELLGSKPTKAERRSTAEIKMSMYEKALDAVEDIGGREKLLVKMMEEAPNIWDNQKLSTRWSQVLKSDPGCLNLWITYLDFKQTAFLSFKYEVVRDVFLNSIQILRESNMSGTVDTMRRENIYANRIFIMLRMTLFMRESGFLEHAIAAWQALLEFEFFTPSVHSLDRNQAEGSPIQGMLSDFERFWDSEVSRIGEEGAKGWASVSEAKGQPLEQETGSIDDSTPQGNDLLSTWVAIERMQAFQSRQPARTTDEVTENDPYRMILSSDIEAFLACSPSTHGRSVLLDAFILFCQLPLYGESRTGTRWYRNEFFRNETLYFDHEVLFSDHGVTDLPRSEILDKNLSQFTTLEHPPFSTWPTDFHLDSEILFAKAGSWFSAFDSWKNINNIRQSPLEPTWVLRALKGLLTSDIGDEQLAEYVLALELCLFPASVKRTAKNLLKKRPLSLRLYNAYALIEFRLENIEKAENVLITAINMSKDVSNVRKEDCILLWRTWIWQLLNEGHSDEAFSRLQSYGSSAVEPIAPRNTGMNLTNPTKTLRTESALRAFREHAVSLRSTSHAVLVMECLILFEYLKDTTTLSAAIAAFTANLQLLINAFTSDESNEVSLRQSFARLLYHHATHQHHFKPSEIRTFLAESVTRFPQNTIFLSLYAWNETRFRIDDRVRSIVQDVVLGTNDARRNGADNVVSHLFAIHAEMNLGVRFGSNDNTIRATFERAVESRSGGHCAAIWKLYFLFEHSRRTLKKATAVFFRAIRACPWVKELYLLPFEYLRDGPGAMQEVDLRGVYDLMVEKELRVHVDLEELLEQQET